MTKEVVTEYDDSGIQFVPAACNCTVGAYRYCPLHGYRYGYGYSPTITSPTITINSGTSAQTVSGAVAATVRTHASAMGR